MLGEYGLWYKMTFREWSCRIPMLFHCPSRLPPRVVDQPAALVDILPSLVDFACDGNQVLKPDPIVPLDGKSLWPLGHGEGSVDGDAVVSEYLAEGTVAPMLMIRKGHHKFISCATDPDQLYDLSRDANEEHNIAGEADCARLVEDFNALVQQHWDSDALRSEVIADQARRRWVHDALRTGRFHGWDYDPAEDPGQMYTRSHMDLTRHDIVSRYPRPEPFSTLKA